MKKRYIELHLHLDGAITPDIAKDLAALQKIKLPYKDERELEKALMVSKDCRSLNEFWNALNYLVVYCRQKKE